MATHDNGAYVKLAYQQGWADMEQRALDFLARVVEAAGGEIIVPGEAIRKSRPTLNRMDDPTTDAVRLWVTRA